MLHKYFNPNNHGSYDPQISIKHFQILIEIIFPKVESPENFSHFCYLLYIAVWRISKYTFLCVMETNLMHYLSSVYFVNQPLHVTGIFVAHHQEVQCACTATGTWRAFQLTVCWPAKRQSTEKHNTYQLLYSDTLANEDNSFRNHIR